MGDCSTEGLVDIEEAEPGSDVMPDEDDDPGKHLIKTALNVLPVFQSPVNDPPGADENSLESDDVYGTGDKDD